MVKQSRRLLKEKRKYEISDFEKNAKTDFESVFQRNNFSSGGGVGLRF